MNHDQDDAGQPKPQVAEANSERQEEPVQALAASDLSARIEGGDYYAQARDWYSLVYIGPISQRIFYIIVTSIAGVIFLMAFAALINLLPISPRVPFVIRANDIMNEVPQIIRFKAANEEPNPALIRYYLRTYVTMRESYNWRQFLQLQAFVRSYTSGEEFREYQQAVSQNNPQSAIRRYGKFGELEVKIQNVRFNREVIPHQAEVDFSTILSRNAQQEKTNWTATIAFEYTELEEKNVYCETPQTDPVCQKGMIEDDYALKLQEPAFRVISYEKRERLFSGNRP